MENKFIPFILTVLVAMAIQQMPGVPLDAGIPAVRDTYSTPLPAASEIKDEPLKILQPAILAQAINVPCSGQDIFAHTPSLNDFSYSIYRFFRQNSLFSVPVLKNIFYHLVNINAP